MLQMLLNFRLPWIFSVLTLLLLHTSLCFAKPSPWDEKDVQVIFDSKVDVNNSSQGIYHIEVTQGDSTGTHKDQPTLTFKVLEVMYAGDIKLNAAQHYKALWRAYDIQSLPRMTGLDYNDPFWKEFTSSPPTGRQLLIKLDKPSSAGLPIELNRTHIYEASLANLERARSATSDLRVIDVVPTYLFNYLLFSPVLALVAYFIRRGAAFSVGLLSSLALYIMFRLKPAGGGGDFGWILLLPSLAVLYIISTIDIHKLLEHLSKKQKL
jgi:hypothetical protein